VGGRQYEVDNREHVEWMGRFIGRIHGVAKGTHFIHRPYISVDEYSVFTLQTLHNSSLIPSGLQQVFFTVLQQVVDLVLSLYISTKNIRLHSVSHPGNIFWRYGRPLLI
jgi:Ser/Thr protein kinase RdoA (MazF antagonist)